MSPALFVSSCCINLMFLTKIMVSFNLKSNYYLGFISFSIQKLTYLGFMTLYWVSSFPLKC